MPDQETVKPDPAANCEVAIHPVENMNGSVTANVLSLALDPHPGPAEKMAELGAAAARNALQPVAHDTSGGARSPSAPVPPEPPHRECVMPDGPFEPCGFRYNGTEIEFIRAPLRYRLVCELWDVTTGKPSHAQKIEKVIDSIWPDDDAAEYKLKNLCSQVRKVFERHGFPLKVRIMGNWIRLELQPQ